MKMLVVMVFIVIMIQSLVTQPINQLIEHIREIDADGHLTREPRAGAEEPQSTDTEITEIRNAIDNLETDLRSSYVSLSKSKEELDLRVEERTQELKEAREIAEELARIDPLTELNNRRAFFDYAGRVHKQARRVKGQYAVLMIDIDYFKQVNDQYGHESGDEVLKTVSRILESRARETDVLGRLGGEEFAIILPDTSSTGAVELAEHIRDVLARTPTSTQSEEISVTASIGVAHCADVQESFQSTLARADDALYEAKRPGRNKVELAEEQVAIVY